MEATVAAVEIPANETKSQMQQRHKKEQKELRAKTDAILAKVPKHDKDLKKKTVTEIQKMNVEMNRRHEKELADLKAKEDAALPQQGDDAQEDDFASALLAKLHVEEKPAEAAPAAAPTKSAPAPAPGAKKTSRAAKRKAEKTQKEKEKLERIHNVEETQNSARTQEYELFKRKLEPMGLKIREIVPDGNCLYTSLSEQLSLHGKTGYTWSLLRIMAGNYMEENPDDFEPFMDLPSPDQYKAYCAKVKSDPSTWGSQLEIKALVNQLRVPIHIYTADAPVVKMGEEFAEDEEELLVAFHKHAYALGEHYNSIVPLDAPDIAPVGERIAQRKNKKQKEQAAEGEEDEGAGRDRAHDQHGEDTTNVANSLSHVTETVLRC
eukprot:TRINITY_DN4618_c0_g1_i2.p1 TRINITY_DN4618_c0_g1~~TRINITY_DN4618_c0_g1_i2.p1  ORF type:complete len:378 (+),score=112.57 TRINITY_DN4618_c0_g1_i2:33-1166(+)